MGAHRGTARKMAPPLCGALIFVLFLLALLFSVLQPGQTQAQAQSDELWFTVTFQSGGDFNVTGNLRFDFLSYLDPINVYRDGTAYAEFTNSEEGVRTNCSFEGKYDQKTRTLTGRYESSYFLSDPGVGEYTETFTGTLEGTLEYREGEYSDGEVVDTIFTMKGNILCTGQGEYIDLDGYGEDESYTEDLEIDYDFVANGNTGPEVPAEDEAGEGSKIPGPGSWWQWLTGTVVAGGVAAGTGLVNTLLGGAPPPAPAAVTGPTPSLWTMPDMPEPGIASGTVDPFDLQRYPDQPERNIVEGSLEYIGEGVYVHGKAALEKLRDTGHTALIYGKAALNTLWDTGRAVISGTIDFIGGTLKTIGKGWVELGGLVKDLVWDDPIGTLKDMFSPTVIGHTLVNIGGEVLESVNPIEELKSLNDPHMSIEGKCWAVSSIALKVANALLIKEGLKDLKNSLTRTTEKPVVSGPEPATPPKPAGRPSRLIRTKGRGLANVEEVLPEEAAIEKVVSGPEPATPPKPAGRTSRMSQSEAVASAEKVVPEEAVAEYEALKAESKAKVDRFAEKVESGAEITPEDVLEVTDSEVVTREALGKTERPISPKVKEAVHEGRRKLYNATDEQVAAELKKGNPKYAEGKIRPKEVSTGGEADAVKSTDRDVQYVHERQVTGKDGKARTVVEDVPASEVRDIHNRAFAENTGFDPNKPVEGIDPERWKNLSLEEKQALHAEKYGQNVIDRVSDEFIPEYRTDKGPGKLTSDPEWKAKIYAEDKFGRLWKEGSVGKQTEALEQLGKMGDAAEEAALESGRKLDPQTMDALEIIKDKRKAPAVRDQAVKNLGFRGGVEGLKIRLRSIIESKKLSGL